jgi:hypothetical protein
MTMDADDAAGLRAELANWAGERSAIPWPLS